MTMTEGMRLRDRGMGIAIAGAPEEYKSRFHSQFDKLVGDNSIFCAEDITARVGMPPNPNSVGGLFNAGVKRHANGIEIVGYKSVLHDRGRARRTPLYRSRG